MAAPARLSASSTALSKHAPLLSASSPILYAFSTFSSHHFYGLYCSKSHSVLLTAAHLRDEDRLRTPAIYFFWLGTGLGERYRHTLASRLARVFSAG